MNQREEKGEGKTEREKKRKKGKQAELIIIGEAVKASSVLLCPQSWISASDEPSLLGLQLPL